MGRGDGREREAWGGGREFKANIIVHFTIQTINTTILS